MDTVKKKIRSRAADIFIPSEQFDFLMAVEFYNVTDFYRKYKYLDGAGEQRSVLFRDSRFTVALVSVLPYILPEGKVDVGGSNRIEITDSRTGVCETAVLDCERLQSQPQYFTVGGEKGEKVRFKVQLKEKKTGIFGKLRSVFG